MGVRGQSRGRGGKPGAGSVAWVGSFIVSRLGGRGPSRMDHLSKAAPLRGAHPPRLTDRSRAVGICGTKSPGRPQGKAPIRYPPGIILGITSRSTNRRPVADPARPNPCPPPLLPVPGAGQGSPESPAGLSTTRPTDRTSVPSLDSQPTPVYGTPQDHRRTEGRCSKIPLEYPRAPQRPYHPSGDRLPGLPASGPSRPLWHPAPSRTKRKPAACYPPPARHWTCAGPQVRG